MKKSLIFLLLFLFAETSSAFAIYSPWKDAGSYPNQATQKLVYGVENAALGWSEIITEPMKHHGNRKQFTNSVGKGLKNAAAYTLGGVFHAVTFPLTNVDMVLPDRGIRL